MACPVMQFIGSGIAPSDNDGTDHKITIYQCGHPETEKVCETAEEALEYMVGEDRLRDVITQVRVVERTI